MRGARLPLRRALEALSANDPDHHDVFPGGRAGTLVGKHGPGPCKVAKKTISRPKTNIGGAGPRAKP